MLNDQQRHWLAQALGYDVEKFVAKGNEQAVLADRKMKADLAEMKSILPDAESLLTRYATDKTGLIAAVAKHGIKDSERFLKLAYDYFSLALASGLAHERLESVSKFEKEIEKGLAKGGQEVTKATFNVGVKGAGDINSGTAFFKFVSGGNIADVERHAEIQGGSCFVKGLAIGKFGTVHVTLQLAELRGQPFEPNGHGNWNLATSAAGTDLSFEVEVGVTEEQISLAKDLTKGSAQTTHTGTSTQTETATSTTTSASATLSDTLTVGGELEAEIGVGGKVTGSNQKQVSGTLGYQGTNGARNQQNSDQSRDLNQNQNQHDGTTSTKTIRKWNDWLKVKMN